MHLLRRILSSRVLWQGALALYWVALVVLTHLPIAAPPVPVRGFDKYLHIVAFGGLAWLVAMTWHITAGYLTARHLRWAWVLLMVFAAVDEITQPYFARRASIADWLADGVGLAGGLVVFAVMQRWIGKWALPPGDGRASAGAARDGD